jgi:hypothetical protein
MNNNKKPDCLIEQAAPNGNGFSVYAIHMGEVSGFKAFFNTVAITKVYLRDSYKEQLENEFPYSY